MYVIYVLLYLLGMMISSGIFSQIRVTNRLPVWVMVLLWPVFLTVLVTVVLGVRFAIVYLQILNEITGLGEYIGAYFLSVLDEW